MVGAERIQHTFNKSEQNVRARSFGRARSSAQKKSYKLALPLRVSRPPFMSRGVAYYTNVGLVLFVNGSTNDLPLPSSTPPNKATGVC